MPGVHLGKGRLLSAHFKVGATGNVNHAEGRVPKAAGAAIERQVSA
jgi:hypothetical protein